MHHDLSRIDRAFAGWQAGAVSSATRAQRCRDTESGPPLALAERLYRYPPNRPSGQIDVTVQYFTLANARRVVATYASADGGLKCPQTHAAAWYRHWARSHPSSAAHAFYVRMTPRVPSWLVRARRGHVTGYQGDIGVPATKASGFNRVHSLVFVYRSGSDPHVVYSVEIDLYKATLYDETPIALRVIHLTR